ncbi:MAG: hypothetical protein KDA93_13620 [Planctomycetaceae bacterium]|nr:hypothetical protein [Planctomycetaceae bacterium]
MTTSDGPTLLTAAQKELYLHALTLGASPTGACGKVGIAAVDVLRTIEHDEQFREQVDRANVMLSQNVAAALYRSAMEGSVSAQTFFLKNKPPPCWQAEDEAELTREYLEELSDEEFVDLCRASGLEPPVDAAPGADSQAVEE